MFAVYCSLLLLNAGRTVRDGFVLWPQVAETRLNHYQTALLDMSRHYEGGPVVIADGFYEPIDRDSFRRDLGVYAPSRWVQTGAGAAGALVIPVDEGAGNGRFYVPEYAAPPTDLLAVGGIPAEPIYRSERTPSFAVYQLPAQFPVPALAAPVVFADRISLMGYETLPVDEAGSLSLFTVWRVEQPLPADLAVFVHLVDAGGEIISQHDGLDAAPATLSPGDWVLQRHGLALPVAALPDNAVLRVGLYQRGDNGRWQPVDQPTDFYTIPISSFDETGEDR